MDGLIDWEAECPNAATLVLASATSRQARRRASLTVMWDAELDGRSVDGEVYLDSLAARLLADWAPVLCRIAYRRTGDFPLTSLSLSEDKTRIVRQEGGETGEDQWKYGTFD